MHQPTIDAMVDSLLAGYAMSDNTQQVKQFINQQIGSQPDFLQLPFALLLRLFNAAAVGHTGHLFHHCTAAQQQQHVQRWRRSKFAYARDFIQFFDSLTALAVFGLLP